MMKQSEVSDSITIRTPKGDGLLEAIKAIAKEESASRGYAVTISDLGRSALRSFVHDHKRGKATMETFKLSTK